MIYDAGQTNDYYMTANNSGVNEAALAALWQDVDLLPEYLVPEHRHGRSFFWMGPAGTVTPVHHDLTNNFMAQVIGRKLVQADLARTFSRWFTTTFIAIPRLI